MKPLLSQVITITSQRPQQAVIDKQYVGRIGVNFDNVIPIAMQPVVMNNRLAGNDTAFIDTPGDFKPLKRLEIYAPKRSQPFAKNGLVEVMT